MGKQHLTIPTCREEKIYARLTVSKYPLFFKELVCKNGMKGRGVVCEIADFRYLYIWGKNGVREGS